MRHPVRTTLMLALLSGALAAPGCGVAYRPYYDPGGSGASIDEFTYWSEPHMPQTVELIDLRTGETLFAVDIPPREQLVIKFVKDHGEEDAWMPDLMKWELMPRGTKRGKLDNSIPVPPSFSRRLDVSLRETAELPDVPRYSEDAQSEQEWVSPPPAADQPAMEPAADPMAEPAPEPMTEPAPEPAEPLIDLPDEPQEPSAAPGQMTPVQPGG